MPTNKPLTKQDLENVVGQLENRLAARIERSTKELVQHFNTSQSQQNEHFEKLLAEHHQSLTESISEIILNDKLKSIEVRLAKLEAERTPAHA